MDPWHMRENPQEDDIFMSGQCVPPGLYREVGSNVVIVIDHFQALPCGDDGGQIEYRRLSDYPNSGLPS